MRELFRQVSDPRSASGGRRLTALPISIAVHVAVLLAVIVIPLVATDVLPAVQFGNIDEYEVIPLPRVPSAPPTLPPRTTVRAPVVNSNAAPVVPPSGISDTGITATAATEIAGPESGVVLTDVPPSLATTEVVDTPPVVKPTTPVRVHTLLRPPTRLRNTPPVYPEMARTARVEGVVIIEAVINQTGDVVEARVLRSVPLLDQAAVDAVRQWKYTPSLLNGVPVPVVMTVTVTFALR